MLKLDLTKSAKKFLETLPAKQFKQVAGKTIQLMENPYPNDSSKLKGFPYYRVDIGEYRIIYYVEEDVLKVVLIGKRNDDEVYKKLSRL
jgi:mRNA interferase RelE/StbE